MRRLRALPCEHKRRVHTKRGVKIVTVAKGRIKRIRSASRLSKGAMEAAKNAAKVGIAIGVPIDEVVNNMVYSPEDKKLLREALLKELTPEEYAEASKKFDKPIPVKPRLPQIRYIALKNPNLAQARSETEEGLLELIQLKKEGKPIPARLRYLTKPQYDEWRRYLELGDEIKAQEAKLKYWESRSAKAQDAIDEIRKKNVKPSEVAQILEEHLANWKKEVGSKKVISELQDLKAQAQNEGQMEKAKVLSKELDQFIARENISPQDVPPPKQEQEEPYTPKDPLKIIQTQLRKIKAVQPNIQSIANMIRANPEDAIRIIGRSKKIDLAQAVRQAREAKTSIVLGSPSEVLRAETTRKEKGKIKEGARAEQARTIKPTAGFGLTRGQPILEQAPVDVKKAVSEGIQELDDDLKVIEKFFYNKGGVVGKSTKLDEETLSKMVGDKLPQFKMGQREPKTPAEKLQTRTAFMKSREERLEALKQRVTGHKFATKKVAEIQNKPVMAPSPTRTERKIIEAEKAVSKSLKATAAIKELGKKMVAKSRQETKRKKEEAKSGIWGEW